MTEVLVGVPVPSPYIILLLQLAGIMNNTLLFEILHLPELRTYENQICRTEVVGRRVH